MTEAFVRIFNMSISASWIVLVVLVLRGMLRKAPRWTIVLLWGVVALRLVCPISLESGMSLLPSAETISPQILTEPFAGIHSGIDLVDNAVNPVIRDAYTVTDVEKSGHTFVLGVKFFSRIWVCGMIALSVYTVFSYDRLRRKVATAVRYRENIYQSEYVTSPFILGVLRPRIYVPYDMEAQELTHVLAHERAHISRGDHWWKPLGYVLLAIHWFNPLMWLAYTMLCRDIELACDEKVIRELNSEQRADYTQALLACSVSHRSIAACPLAFGEVGVKDRVRSVMQYKKPGFWMLFLAILACLGVMVCFLTNPKRASFTIRIVVPAGSEEPFVYSEEEISPLKNYVIVSSGEGLGDTEVILKPVYVEYENVYEPAIYMTPGMPVKLFAEKGGWFKIGINMQNPTQQDKEVFVEVKYVEVRIADGAEVSYDKNQVDWVVNPFASKALCVRIEETEPGESTEPKYNWFDITPFENVTLPGVNTAEFSIERVSDFVQITFETPLYQDGYETHGLQMKLGEWIRLTTKKDGGTAYTFYFADWSEMYADKIHTITVQNYTAQEIGRGEGRPLVKMTEEDAQTLLEIVGEVTEKHQGSTDCLRDCAININGRLFYYHSSCGTVYEPNLAVMSTLSSKEVADPGISYHLTEAQQAEVNEILKKYITLQE